MSNDFTLLTPVWPHAASPFHAAELALQERYGRRETLDRAARRGIRGQLIEQHRAFFAHLPFVVIGSVDASGQAWASILAAQPGFVHSPDPHSLRFDIRPLPGDPLADNLGLGAALGVLGIELPTRRRNRMNGRIVASDENGFSVGVVQSYGNCPKYIQSRDLNFVSDTPAAPRVLRSQRLSQTDRDLLAQADSFYIASNNPDNKDGLAGGADVSHRGGRPGFIRIDDDGTITTPDYAGNNFFNTIGNLAVEARAGLLFVDFKTGDLLLAAARAEIILEGPELASFAGAQRLLRFHLTDLIRLEQALPLRGSDPDYAREFTR